MGPWKSHEDDRKREPCLGTLLPCLTTWAWVLHQNKIQHGRNRISRPSSRRSSTRSTTRRGIAWSRLNTDSGPEPSKRGSEAEAGSRGEAAWTGGSSGHLWRAGEMRWNGPSLGAQVLQYNIESRVPFSLWHVSRSWAATSART